MVDIQPQTVLDETYSDGKPWLVAVERGFNKSVTLDLSKFTDADYLTTADASGRKFIKSGVALKASASGGTYEPATADDDYEGLLFSAVQVVTGSAKSSAALMTHGAISAANVPNGLPTGTGPSLIRVDA